MVASRIAQCVSASALSMRHLALLILPLAVSACGQTASKPSTPPAHAELIANEAELLKLTLTPKAQQRLGIETTTVGGGSAAQMRQVTGEIVVPPTSAGGVPTNSLTNPDLGVDPAHWITCHGFSL